MSDEPQAFTVKDRRHFSTDGSVRTEEETRAAAADPTPEPAREPVETTEPPETTEPADDGPDAPVDFVGFLVSLAAQASMALHGEKPELRGARSIIAILEMLQDKTEGRRTPEESRLLEQILYELRMAYVARAGAVRA